MRHGCWKEASSWVMRQLLNLDFLLLDIGNYKKIWSRTKTVFWYALNTPPPIPPQAPKIQCLPELWVCSKVDQRGSAKRFGS